MIEIKCNNLLFSDFNLTLFCLNYKPRIMQMTVQYFALFYAFDYAFKFIFYQIKRFYYFLELISNF